VSGANSGANFDSARARGLMNHVISQNAGGKITEEDQGGQTHRHLRKRCVIDFGYIVI
jgi:hypothetical protein